MKSDIAPALLGEVIDAQVTEFSVRLTYASGWVAQIAIDHHATWAELEVTVDRDPLWE